MAAPELLRVRLDFADDGLSDCAAATVAALERAGAAALIRGRTVIAVGSRGISHYPAIIAAIVDYVRRCGAEPVIVPAMGSHAGGTAASQRALLEEQGIGASAGAIHSSVETVCLGETSLGDPVHFDAFAAGATCLIVANRVKPHTDFAAPIESGVAKMLLVGLGKPWGAAQAHRSFRKHGFHPALCAGVKLITAAIPTIGVAVVENERHQCLRIEAMTGDSILEREPDLLALARARMARLPMDSLDLLIVEEIGKDVSGSGMDTNVISRKSHPHRSAPDERPRIDYIYVRSLSQRTHGNATGIGLADYCHERVLSQIDLPSTYLNCVTSGTPFGAAIPVHLASDAAVIEAVAAAVPCAGAAGLRIGWIRNTLDLEELWVTQKCLDECPALRPAADAREPIAVDSQGALAPLPPRAS